MIVSPSVGRSNSRAVVVVAIWIGAECWALVGCHFFQKLSVVGNYPHFLTLPTAKQYTEYGFIFFECKFETDNKITGRSPTKSRIPTQQQTFARTNRSVGCHFNTHTVFPRLVLSTTAPGQHRQKALLSVK